jgi:hypothetical protein
VRDFLAGDFLVVQLQDTGTALAEAGSIVCEVENDGVFARRERLLAFPAKQTHGCLEQDRIALPASLSRSVEIQASGLSSLMALALGVWEWFSFWISAPSS